MSNFKGSNYIKKKNNLNINLLRCRRYS